MAEPAVDTNVIKQRLAALEGGRFKTWLKLCAHCGYCADSCFFYQAHDKDPKYMPAYKVIQTLGKLYKNNGEVSRVKETAVRAITAVRADIQPCLEATALQGSQLLLYNVCINSGFSHFKTS